MRLRPGKLPAPLLAELLGAVSHRDPRVVLGPGIGRDAAVIDLGAGRLLVAKTDPVTFAVEQIGWYTVNVNANDIACMGARPAWFLATALLPPGEEQRLAREIFAQIAGACEALDIDLVGGHTEITIGLDRPIVVGAMLGEASRDEIVLGENVRPGDRVLLTKGIAIEGTALLAREAPAALRARGVPDAMIASAAALLFDPGISVVRDARTLCAATRPRLLHDPTEGGLATALYEMAEAASVTLAVDPAAAPLLPQTRAVCDALALDPMGLLASGALLAIVDAADCASVAEALADVKIGCTVIGTVEAEGAGVIIDRHGVRAPLPKFERDELARYFDEAEGA